jgi:hypothetical protein
MGGFGGGFIGSIAGNMIDKPKSGMGNFDFTYTIKVPDIKK